MQTMRKTRRLGVERLEDRALLSGSPYGIPAYFNGVNIPTFQTGFTAVDYGTQKLFLNTRADQANLYSAFNGLAQMHQSSVLSQPIGFQSARAITNYVLPYVSFMANPSNFRPQMPMQPVPYTSNLTVGLGGVIGGTGPYSGWW